MFFQSPNIESPLKYTLNENDWALIIIFNEKFPFQSDNEIAINDK